MRTREIPRNEWNKFFDGFSRQHEGGMATLEIFGSEIGAQEEAHELPLEGVSIDLSREQTISISLGKLSEDHVTHTIVAPERVWLEQTDEGADAALEIESRDDSKALLRFRSTVSA
jgi:uncharacterized protein DUF5335